MSDPFVRAALAAYGLAGRLAYPMAAPYVGYRVSKGKEDPKRSRERYGYASLPRPEGPPVVWLHAASVGESLAVAPLARSIAGNGLTVLMTTGTMTSARIVEDRLGECVIHQFVPLDLKPAVIRFLDHWRPDLAVFAESEVWPTTMMELKARRTPQVLVNGRLSDQSFRRWKAAPSLAEALFETFAHVTAQSEVDGERFRLLGSPAVTVAGNLKADMAPPACRAEDLDAFFSAAGARPRWAAVSTHPGEEEIVAAAHRLVARRHPSLLTILVPRHVDRAETIASALGETGLKVARRSLGQPVTPEVDVLLGDTMGEMGFYLRAADVCFVGKSIAGQGGQNPLEAAMLGTGILTGRFVQNFRDAYQRLLKNGGARLVGDAETMAYYVDHFLSDPAALAQMADAAMKSVGEMRGALDRTVQALQPFIHPLRLAISLEERNRTAPRR